MNMNVSRRNYRISSQERGAATSAQGIHGQASGWLGVMFGLWMTLIAVQFLVFDDWGNALGPIICVLSVALGWKLVLNRETLTTYPLSSLMIAGYLGYYFILPPIGTALELNPLSNNLVHPNLTYVHAGLGFFALLAANIFYRKFDFFGAMRARISHSVFKPLGMFSLLSDYRLLVMGGFGLTAYFARNIVMGGMAAERVGILGKLLEGMSPFAFLPLIAFIRPIVGDDKKTARGFYFVLIPYFALLLTIALTRNSRTELFFGAASVALAYFVGVVTGQIVLRGRRLTYVGITMLAGLLLAGQAQELSASLVIVRSVRSEISPVELITDTWRTFTNKEALRQYIAAGESYQGGPIWDEYYIRNHFFYRLANLKYVDNTIALAEQINEGQEKLLWKFERDRVVALLPGPFLALLHIDVKDEAISGSGGDMLQFIAMGEVGALGVFRTGSLLGQGMALMGYAYPLLLFILAIPVFAIMDAYALPLRTIGGKIAGLALSPIAVVGLYGTTVIFTSAPQGVETYSGVIAIFTRGLVQIIFLYSVFYYCSGLLTGFSARRIQTTRHV
jgi:hypothetical protein